MSGVVLVERKETTLACVLLVPEYITSYPLQWLQVDVKLDFRDS